MKITGSSFLLLGVSNVIFVKNFVALREKHEKEVENLTLTSQPLYTLKLFVEATFLYIKRSILYLLAHGGWFMLITTLLVAFGVLLVTVDGPHGKVDTFYWTTSYIHS